VNLGNSLITILRSCWFILANSTVLLNLTVYNRLSKLYLEASSFNLLATVAFNCLKSPGTWLT
jgi:hypothetical protein